MLEEHDLHYESDVNVCRYVDGEKEILNKEAEISLKEFNELMDKEKATFQVHQPQRFNVRLIDTYLLNLIAWLSAYRAKKYKPQYLDLSI